MRLLSLFVLFASLCLAAEDYEVVVVERGGEVIVIGVEYNANTLAVSKLWSKGSQIEPVEVVLFDFINDRQFNHSADGKLDKKKKKDISGLEMVIGPENELIFDKTSLSVLEEVDP